MVDSRILCRMRAVRAAYETNAVKYRSAGRLLIGSPDIKIGPILRASPSSFLRKEPNITGIPFFYLSPAKYYGD